MTLTPATRVVVPEHVLFQILDDEAVLLNIEKEHFYGLDDVGTSMFVALQEHHTIGAACKALHAEYDVSLDRLEQDLITLVENLLAHELVEIRDA